MPEAVHYIGSWLGTYPPQGQTECGLVVWKCREAGEANTAANDRVEYAELWPKTTCRACLRVQNVKYRRWLRSRR